MQKHNCSVDASALPQQRTTSAPLTISALYCPGMVSRYTRASARWCQFIQWPVVRAAWPLQEEKRRNRGASVAKITPIRIRIVDLTHGDTHPIRGSRSDVAAATGTQKANSVADAADFKRVEFHTNLPPGPHLQVLYLHVRMRRVKPASSPVSRPFAAHRKKKD